MSKPSYYEYDHNGELKPVYDGKKNGRFRWVDGKMVRIGEGRLPSHFAGSDEIEVKSMADGKMYSSRSEYYQSLKNSGHRVLEADEVTPSKPEYKPDMGDIKKDIAKTMQSLGC